MADLVLGYAAGNASALPCTVYRIGEGISVALVPGETARSQFHKLVAACCRAAAFLPARHGVEADDKFLARCILEVQSIAKAISAVGRQVEIAIGVTLPARSTVDGRHYLSVRRREEEQLEDFAGHVSSLAGRLGGRCHVQRRAGGFDASLVISRGAMTAAADGIRCSETALNVRVTGPWPPYRFAASLVPEFA